MSCEWGEPRALSNGTSYLSGLVKVSFGDKILHSFDVKCYETAEAPIFEEFASSLREAKALAIRGGLIEWDKYLSQPHVRDAEKKILNSRSFKEYPRFLDAQSDDGRPHDYALYRDYVWTLDEDLRFDDDLPRLDKRLDQEWQKILASIEVPAAFLSTSRLSLPEPVRHEVWRRDRGCCCRCGSQERLEFDHIIPLAMGGSNTARNIQLLCENCNRRKGASLSVV